jgi:hypothetical protein
VAVLIISLVVMASCGGFGLHLLGTSGTAQCAGQTMKPSDICQDLTHGTQKTYEQSQAEQSSAIHFFGWILIAGAVVALLVALGSLIGALPARRKRA